jgi:hypothetical protein
MSGLAMAPSAASSARLSPEASPVPFHRAAHFAHDGADVGEVEIDEAFLDYQVGDAGDAGIEHLVGHREGVGEGGLLVRHPEQVLITPPGVGQPGPTCRSDLMQIPTVT